MLDGDLPLAEALLHDPINAMVDFPCLAAGMGVTNKNLRRMFSATGNSRAVNRLGALAGVREGACRG